MRVLLQIKKEGVKVEEGGRIQKGSMGKFGLYYVDESFMMKSFMIEGIWFKEWKEFRLEEQGLDCRRVVGR